MAQNDTAIPLPYTWTPSGQFDGIDGKWSTFYVNIGDDASGKIGENFRVLISVSGSLTVVPGPLQNDWCEDGPDTAAECAKARGIELTSGAVSDGYDATKHRATWQFNANGRLATGLEVDFGVDQNATYGSDNVGLGDASSTSLIVQKAPVATTQSQEFFLGYFGLSNIPINIADVVYKPFLPSFKDGGSIGTLSYSYTAGLSSASSGRGVPGSLILGGKDLARYNPSKTVPIAMPNGEDSSLVVTVRSIVVTEGSNPVTVGSTFNANIDSNLPYFWFPQDICDQIAEQFDLQYDDDYDLYVPQNRAANSGKSLTLQIGNAVRDSNAIDITLPYSSLELDASWPLVGKNVTDYKFFPLKNGSDDSFVLGRAFLQHAYIMVDFDQHNFTVAEAVYGDPMPSSTVVPIYPKGYDYSGAGGGSGGSKGLSGAAKGGIAGGVIGGVLILLALVVFFFLRRKRQEKQQKQPDEKGYFQPETPGSPPPMYPEKPPYPRRISELEDGSSRGASAQGFYDHRRSESGSNITELMGSPPMNSDEKAYLKQAALETEPAPLAELPGDHGMSELRSPVPGRPKARRHRSSGSGGSNGRVQSPESERPDPIQEAEEHSPIERRVATPEVTVMDIDQNISSTRVESPDPEELTRGTMNTTTFSETSLEGQTQRTETTNASSITRASSQSETTQTKSGSGLLS